jgi:hypothetical protein
MRVFDITKTIELNEYDLNKGYLKDDKLFIALHPSVEAVQEQGHYETIAEYPNGGKDVEWVVDIPAVEAKEAYEEYEDIQVYIPYTEEELEKHKKKTYPILVEQYIREKYSLSDELAILRQRDTKPAEFIEYDIYAETCKTRAKEELKNIYK